MTEQQDSTICVKKPKKVLHFSDGVLEYFDDDEDDETKHKGKAEAEVNEVS